MFAHAMAESAAGAILSVTGPVSHAIDTPCIYDCVLGYSHTVASQIGLGLDHPHMLRLCSYAAGTDHGVANHMCTGTCTSCTRTTVLHPMQAHVLYHPMLHGRLSMQASKHSL